MGIHCMCLENECVHSCHVSPENECKYLYHVSLENKCVCSLQVYLEDDVCVYYMCNQRRRMYCVTRE